VSPSVRLCMGCKELREIAYVEFGRGYCSECVVSTSVGMGMMIHAMGFESLEIPFKVGDRVAARTAGELYDGTGTVTDISFDLENTPAYPMFCVVIEEKADDLAPESAWYSERCLTKVGEGISTAGSPSRTATPNSSPAPRPSEENLVERLESYLQRVSGAAGSS
jgi:hypothetical protein